LQVIFSLIVNFLNEPLNTILRKRGYALSVLWLTCAHLGRTAEAEAALAEFMRLQPGVTLRDKRAKRPFRLALDQERWRSGLRKAGLPE
jgi:hypothetical protein